MVTEIRLFTTLGCHLCEQAAAMLNYVLQNDSTLAEKYRVSLVEIADDNQLLETYGIRIPVLAANSMELGWPFELEELEHWLRGPN